MAYAPGVAAGIIQVATGPLSNCVAAYEQAATTCALNDVVTACRASHRIKGEGETCGTTYECKSDQGPADCSERSLRLTYPFPACAGESRMESAAIPALQTCATGDSCQFDSLGTSADAVITLCFQQDDLYCTAGQDPGSLRRQWRSAVSAPPTTSAAPATIARRPVGRVPVRVSTAIRRITAPQVSSVLRPTSAPRWAWPSPTRAQALRGRRDCRDLRSSPARVAVPGAFPDTACPLDDGVAADYPSYVRRHCRRDAYATSTHTDRCGARTTTFRTNVFATAASAKSRRNLGSGSGGTATARRAPVCGQA